MEYNYFNINLIVTLVFTMVSTTSKLKTEVSRQVESRRDELIDLSLKIHSNPELGFHEEKALSWLTDYLVENGFRVEKGVGGLPTAFKALYGKGKPVIALIAEYDALPETGHSCGHNIIAVSSIGAGIAGKCAVDSLGGAIAVIGTPAEELYGGKVTMVRAGVFNELDAVMMVHPGVRNIAITEALACATLKVEFFGKAAHAAAYPEQGINALEAMVLAFNALNSLRQHIKDRARIHGIITYGGESANVVPAYSAATFLVRAPDDNYLGEMRQKVIDCFTGASIATGARLEHKWDDIIYETMNNNLSLARLFAQNLETLGRKVEPFEISFGFGSTDMGNVSQVVPAIHPMIAITTPDISLHSPEFAAAAASEGGHSGLIDAAKALAMTVVDVLGASEALASISTEFLGQS